MKVYVWGQRGRIGLPLVQNVPAFMRADRPEDASCWVLAVPTTAAEDLLNRAGGRTIIDLSGALKKRGGGRYALLDGDTLLDGQPPRPGDRLANPGCFAGSVIVALRQSGLAANLSGPLHISGVGGKSTAHRDQDGGIRLARRLRSHPHAREIQDAIPRADIHSFALMIAYAQPAGILTVTSGTYTPGAHGHNTGQPHLDVQDVLGSPEVAWRLEAADGHFTLAAAVDNIHFPVHNALKLIQVLHRQSAASQRE